MDHAAHRAEKFCAIEEIATVSLASIRKGQKGIDLRYSVDMISPFVLTRDPNSESMRSVCQPTWPVLPYAPSWRREGEGAREVADGYAERTASFIGRMRSRRQVVQALVGGTLATGLVSLPNVAAAARSETLIVPFDLGTQGVQTSRAYSGPITIIVSGYGQAAGTQESDAFYIFTDSDGNPVTPWHEAQYYNFGLWINGGPVDNWVAPIPDYQNNHTYTIKIFAPGSHLTFAFGVGDADVGDNSGAFTVTVTKGGPPGQQRG